MIQQFVDVIVEHKEEIKAELAKTILDNKEKCSWENEVFYYKYIHKKMLEYINKYLLTGDTWDTKPFVIEEEEITRIDNGDYQGTFLYFWHVDHYQPEPEEYYWTSIGYGSCSVCDTMLGIESDYNFAEDKAEGAKVAAEELWLLMLHMAQQIKPLISTLFPTKEPEETEYFF